jgi:tetratricopeptide (TPR) repeat protein
MPLSSDALGQHLHALDRAGLTQLAQLEPDLEYVFSHGLIQDAAYESLLKQDRKILHQHVGEVLESLFPERRTELAAQIGQHYYASGDYPRAFTFLLEAGDNALSRYANQVAAIHYTLALEIVQQHGVTVPDEQIHGLYFRMGRALELFGQFERALANYADMEAAALQRGNPGMRLAALTARATIFSMPSDHHDPAQAETLLEQALTLADSIGDQPAEAKILWNLSLLNSWTGQPEKSVQYGERAIDIARRLNLAEQLAYILNDISFGYLGTGHIDRALADLDEAQRLWRELNNLPMLADNLSRSAMVFFMAGQYEPAFRIAHEDLGLSQASGNEWGQASSLAILGRIDLDRGEFDAALAHFQESHRLAEQAGHAAEMIRTALGLGSLLAALGPTREGLDASHRAVDIAKRLMPQFLPIASGGLAQYYVTMGSLDEAETLINAVQPDLNLGDWSVLMLPNIVMADVALRLARHDYAHALVVADDILSRSLKAGIRNNLPELLYLKGAVLLAQARLAEAGEAAQQARTQAEASRAGRLLWRILLQLSTIKQRQGHKEAALSLRHEAREAVQAVASHISDPELRQIFLSQPEVREALRESE